MKSTKSVHSKEKFAIRIIKYLHEEGFHKSERISVIQNIRIEIMEPYIHFSIIVPYKGLSEGYVRKRSNMREISEKTYES